ncbi:hypothetical protein RHA1_ro05382 [Rhodococcus jostii RHA1]|uniref:Uncharacterized protein n=1 Tax=Rhodococcus jostii (strain RHA1) TaxID=101510 RepID=Q0S5M4_RHOJR|nr:hypothetical protein RHA1_ro05382 [Rhodococcus jostii RHA1]
MQVFLPYRFPDEDRERHRQCYPHQRDPGNPPHTSSMPAPWTPTQGLRIRRGPWGLVGSANSEKLPGHRWFAARSSGHPLR